MYTNSILPAKRVIASAAFCWMLARLSSPRRFFSSVSMFRVRISFSPLSTLEELLVLTWVYSFIMEGINGIVEEFPYGASASRLPSRHGGREPVSTPRRRRSGVRTLTMRGPALRQHPASAGDRFKRGKQQFGHNRGQPSRLSVSCFFHKKRLVNRDSFRTRHQGRISSSYS